MRALALLVHGIYTLLVSSGRCRYACISQECFALHAFSRASLRVFANCNGLNGRPLLGLLTRACWLLRSFSWLGWCCRVRCTRLHPSRVVAAALSPRSSCCCLPDGTPLSIPKAGRTIAMSGRGSASGIRRRCRAERSSSHRSRSSVRCGGSLRMIGAPRRRIGEVRRHETRQRMHLPPTQRAQNTASTMLSEHSWLHRAHARTNRAERVVAGKQQTTSPKANQDRHPVHHGPGRAERGDTCVHV